MLDATDYALANRWQRGFPLEARPFARIAEEAGVSEDAALERYRRLQRDGVIDRIGPVFRPNAVGASSLAAMAVPPERLEAVAHYVSDQAGINHNYEREHRYNLWFVATGSSAGEVQWTLSCIEHATGLRVLRLPLLEEFHIDLGFDLGGEATPRAPSHPASYPPLGAEEQRLVREAVHGLPIVAEPYAAVAAKLGSDAAHVIAALERMLADGRIRRIGAVVRHRPLGYQANAMAVWDIPDERAAAVGRLLAAQPSVTLCYRRARALPDWPYNVYCMVHGRERQRVAAEVARLSALSGAEGFASAVLFSRRCFTQRAAHYG
ncbi:MAG: AsnC family transcriptional regulator [Clostridia bacterium]